MAYSNYFDLLTDYDNDDPSLFITDLLKAAAATRSSTSSRDRSKKPTVKAPAKTLLMPVPQGPQPKPVKERTASSGFDDVENNCVLESGFHRKFSVAEDGEVNKSLSGGGRNGRSYRRGGLRRSYQSNSRYYCRPGRAYVDGESEDFAVMMSSKYKLFDRHGSHGCGTAVKKNEGYGKWNWGTVGDDVGLEESPVGLTNFSGTLAMIEMQALETFEGDVYADQTDEDESDSEDKEMTFAEYEKVMEEKRNALQAMLLERSANKNNIDEFIKQGLEKELSKRTDDKEEMADGFVIVYTP